MLTRYQHGQFFRIILSEYNQFDSVSPPFIVLLKNINVVSSPKIEYFKIFRSGEFFSVFRTTIFLYHLPSEIKTFTNS